MFYKNDKLGVFIDGTNLYATAKALGFDIDYKALHKWFLERGILTRAYYYTAILENEEFNAVKPLTDWLTYNGFEVVTKVAKEYTDSAGRRKVKGNMDVELTVDVMNMAPKLNHVLLFTGDGDFTCLVEAVKRIGTRVTVVSTTNTSPSMISDSLRRAADTFIDLQELKAVLARPDREET